MTEVILKVMKTTRVLPKWNALCLVNLQIFELNIHLHSVITNTTLQKIEDSLKRMSLHQRYRNSTWCGKDSIPGLSNLRA